MVALLLALKQVLQGNHFSVMQDEKVALLQRLFLRKYNTQECEGTSYVPRTSGRYILEETANVVYVQSKARDVFNDSPLELVITLEQTPKTDWAVHYRFVRKGISAIKHVYQNKDSDAVTSAFNV